MRTFFLSAAAALVLSANAGAALPAMVDGEALPSLAPLVERVSPAVVNIQVSSTGNRGRVGNDPFREFFGMPSPRSPRQMSAAGSGVIVDADNGYILTNHHVIENADRIEITLQNGRSFTAELVGSDPETDVAVLKADEDDLVDIRIGDSDGARVGDFVIAIGNPFGLEHTVTSGIVSALGRRGIGDGYEDFIQTDASINPGNSGGALINLAGELVGINSAIISRTGGNVGIGFAIPSNMAQGIMRQILEYGEVRRGLLGVQIGTLTGNEDEMLGLRNVTGAIVLSVSPGSAAERAGIEANDVITAVNGEKVDSAGELRNTIGLMRSGEEVAITAVRGGEVQSFTATLDERDAGRVVDAVDIYPGLAGASLANSDDGRGIAIVSVQPDSPADTYGLRAGDVIVGVNRRPVSSIDELSELALANSNMARIFVSVERNGRQRVVPVGRR